MANNSNWIKLVNEVEFKVVEDKVVDLPSKAELDELFALSIKPQ